MQKCHHDTDANLLIIFSTMTQGIHSSVQQAALALGILPLPRLSVVHLHSVALLTGALPISTILPSSAWAACLGVLRAVRLEVPLSRTLIGAPKGAFSHI